MKPRSYRLGSMQRLSSYGVLIAFVVQLLAWSVMPVSAQGVESDDGWVVICTANGFKRIPLTQIGISPNTPQDDTQSIVVLGDHCELCLFAQSLGSVPGTISLPEEFNSMRVVQSRAPYRIVLSSSRSPQQPRAPPVS